MSDKKVGCPAGVDYWPQDNTVTIFRKIDLGLETGGIASDFSVMHQNNASHFLKKMFK